MQSIDLGAFLRDAGSRTLAEKLGVLMGFVEDLAMAHAQGTVHGLLGKRCVSVQGTGTVTIDFSPGAVWKSLGANLSASDYPSPEQLRGDAPDLRSDVFATGCILYEMLGGRPPFRSASLPGLLYQISHDEPPPLASIARDLPAGLSELVTKALRKDPAERFRSAIELEDALEQCIGPSNESVRPAAGVRPESYYFALISGVDDTSSVYAEASYRPNLGHPGLQRAAANPARGGILAVISESEMSLLRSRGFGVRIETGPHASETAAADALDNRFDYPF
jgi:serine/threonine protein kinase